MPAIIFLILPMLKSGGWDMIKKWIWSGMILLAMICAGCSTKKTQPMRVVTQVDVICDRGNEVLRRHYTKPRKMSMVLNYLRLQKNLGQPEVDPDAVPGTRMQIDVTMSDGSHRFYYQQSGQFLAKKNENWHEINPELASEFDIWLQVIPPDVKTPCPKTGGTV